ncbi:unnamed protein product [Vicia faba]|uniref:Uncharacterized protein n=1 Tax=Vicia faba TaxID=3906 RepID=A0AAV1B935_VICFA|nr:unnamed protein product [Vicia faba]
MRRDIKSSCILLDEDYEAKSAEFGVTRFAGRHGYIAPAFADLNPCSQEIPHMPRPYKNAKYEEALEKFDSVLGTKPELEEATFTSYNVAC